MTPIRVTQLITAQQAKNPYHRPKSLNPILAEIFYNIVCHMPPEWVEQLAKQNGAEIFRQISNLDGFDTETRILERDFSDDDFAQLENLRAYLDDKKQDHPDYSKLSKKILFEKYYVTFRLIKKKLGHRFMAFQAPNQSGQDIFQIIINSKAFTPEEIYYMDALFKTHDYELLKYFNHYR